MSLPSGGPTLTAQNVTVTFGGVDVVKDASLDLRPGEILAIAGENGAGKSSLAKVLAGVYRPRLGELRLGNEILKFEGPRDALQKGIALIHQEPLTFAELDVAENIFAGHHPKRAAFIDWTTLYTEATRILGSLGLTLNPREKAGNLSIAEQQYVELACAMSQSASVWIFDETTAALTPKEADELFAVMRRLKSQGCAVAMVTHHMHDIVKVSDRVTVMRDGEVVANLATSETSVKQIVQVMVGRELSQECFPKSPATNPPLLETNLLTGEGFKDISITVRPGEVHCLAGLVGSGRTELARALFGITQPVSGTIIFSGRVGRFPDPKSAIESGIALVPEDRHHHGLLGPQSVAFNTTLPTLERHSPGGWIRPEGLKKLSTAWANKLSLRYQHQDQPVEQLSGGNQQKVVLSKWLISNPKLLILDEPTRGVDVGAKHEVHSLIREQVNGGMAVLVISSDLPEVQALADRISVMKAGRIVSELDGNIATQDQIMQAATGTEELAE